MIYGGVTGKSVKSLLLGDNSVPSTPPTPIDRGSAGTVTDTSGGTVTGTVTSPSGKMSGTGILPKIGKIIGRPFEGTHAKKFNVAGGSDNWQSENAVDIATPVGTPVYAPTSGVIAKAGSLGKGGRFAGLRIDLNGQGDNFYFAHLSKLAVNQGANVNAGQLLGWTGSANGVAHLHFAVENGSPIDWVLAHIVTSH